MEKLEKDMRPKLLGETFKKYPAEKSKQKYIYGRYQCQYCNEEFEATIYNVKKGATKSCGGYYPSCNPPLAPCTIGFNRFGIDYGALITAYPSKNVFSFAVYARKDPAKNVTSDNDYQVKINKFTNCNFVASATANGVDFSRTGVCGELGVSYFPGIFTYYTLTGAPTTFTKIGDIIYTKSTDTVLFQHV